MKKLWVLGGAAAAVLVAVVVARTALVRPAPRAPAADALAPVDAEAAAVRLAGALQIPTVTHNDRARVDWTQWPKLHAYLARTFPRTHGALGREVVGEHSLLYTWTGTDPAARPVLLLAHQDVVPIEPGTEGTWEHPPFAGTIAGGFVWGRGALDDKSSLVAQLEAVEHLLALGFAPRRTILFAFGHDEEVGGHGAIALARALAARGVRAEWSLDEGGSITRGIVAGVAGPVASIMTAEKGYVSLRLGARDAGGHSSRPPPVTAIGRVARAVASLEREPFPTRLAPPVTDMLDRLAPELPWPDRMAITNRWLLGGVVAGRMARGSVTGALVRTTTAATIFHSGIKDNILPVEASAVVNFRVLPGESLADVEARVRSVIDDPDVTITREDFASEPSPVAGTDTPGFAALERTVNEVFPDAVVTAGLVIGATDSRHYAAVRDVGYNFAPLTITDADLTRVHGANERVAVADHARAIQFYERLLRNVASP